MNKKTIFSTISKESVNISSINETQNDVQSHQRVPHYARQTESSVSLLKRDEKINDKPVELVRLEKPSSPEKERHFMTHTESSSNRNTEKEKDREQKLKKGVEKLNDFKKIDKYDTKVPHFMKNTKSSSNRNTEKEKDRNQSAAEKSIEPLPREKSIPLRRESGENKSVPHFMTHTESTSARYTPEKTPIRKSRSKEIPTTKGTIPHFMTPTESSAKHFEKEEEEKKSKLKKIKQPQDQNHSELPNFMIPTKSFLLKTDKTITDEKNPEDQFIITPLTEEEQEKYNKYMYMQVRSSTIRIKDKNKKHEEQVEEIKNKKKEITHSTK